MFERFFLVGETYLDYFRRKDLPLSLSDKLSRGQRCFPAVLWSKFELLVQSRYLFLFSL